MKKRILFIIFCLIFITGCSFNGSSEFNDRKLTNKDLAITIDNVTYKYPWDLAQFAKNGWGFDYYLDDYNNTDLSPGNTRSFMLFNTSKSSQYLITIIYENQSSKTKKVKDCTPISIEYSDNTKEKNSSVPFKLVNGLQSGDSKEKVDKYFSQDSSSHFTYPKDELHNMPSYRYDGYNYEMDKNRKAKFFVFRFIEEDFVFRIRIEVENNKDE